MKLKKWMWIPSMIIVVALWTGGCEDDGTTSGPGMEDMLRSGSRFSVEKLWAQDENEKIGIGKIDVLDTMVISGATGIPDIIINVIDNYPVTMEVTLANVTCEQGKACSDDNGTDIFVEYYRVDYLSSEEGSVPLDSLEYVAFNYLLLPGIHMTFKNILLLMKIDTKIEYVTKGGRIYPEVIYEFRVTFFGVNEFGEEIQAQGSCWGSFTNWEDEEEREEEEG